MWLGWTNPCLTQQLNEWQAASLWSSLLLSIVLKVFVRYVKKYSKMVELKCKSLYNNHYHRGCGIVPNPRMEIYLQEMEDPQ